MSSAPALVQADTVPPTASTPATVSADALPTAQIDGVAWSQVVVGNTVFVGGKFTTARPAGAAPGVSTTPRVNLLAYDITTGNLITTWAPSTNGDVFSITASPDGKRIYLGGNFTQVNGQARGRVAALDATTGALVAGFSPSADSTVRAVVASATTVYFGGAFSTVNGVLRNKLASARATDGALLPWAPNAQGGGVQALAISPDGTKVLIGGHFTTLNGSSNPGYGLGAVTSDTGTLLPWAANSTVRNAGKDSAILSLTTSGDSVYATGYIFGTGGNLEGMTRMNWSDGSRVWVEDCHGDTYGAYPVGDVVYSVSHAHYCGNLPDGFPETNPRSNRWATAYTKATTGTLTSDPYGYPSWGGTPSPSLLKWAPLLASGTASGQNQAGWSVVGNGTYVAYAGEFPTVNGVGQQGLVRFGPKSVAPNLLGPVVTGARQNPGVTSTTAGTARIAWQANWDRDNEQLTYQVIRNSRATPAYQVTQLSSEWSRPMMGFLDTGLTPGATYKYRIFVTDPLGNQVKSDTVSVVVAGASTASAYAKQVVADGAGTYWRLGESSGTTAYDSAGFNDGLVGAGVSRGAAGAFGGDTDKASTFNGTSTGILASKPLTKAPSTFTTEAWFKTTSTTGGKIIGFGSTPSNDSLLFDRHVYLTNTGSLVFGVKSSGTMRTVSGVRAYNDGRWHHVVATLGSGGIALYADGARIGLRTDITTAQSYPGYWRVGGDNLTGWPSAPTSKYLNGTIDDVGIYPTALTASQVATHYAKAAPVSP